MSWWEQDAEGNSLVNTDLPEEKKLMWGDSPADIIDSALAEIKVEFLRALGRMPSQAEIVAGIAFSTRALDELAEVPEHAPHANAAERKVIREYGYAAYGGVASDEQRDAWMKVREVLNSLENGTLEGCEVLGVPEEGKIGPLSEDDFGFIRSMTGVVFHPSVTIPLPSGQIVSGVQMAELMQACGKEAADDRPGAADG